MRILKETNCVLVVCVVLCICMCSPISLAANVNAASCSSSDVQAAINSASTGDTVVVPSGSCTWSSQVTISGKALTLQGQTVCNGTPGVQVTSCTDTTTITTAYSFALYITGSAGNFVTVTGFTFVDGESSSNGSIDLNGAHGQVSFRFHHNHMKSNTGGVFIKAEGTYGLLDHVLWDETGTTGMNPPIVFGGDFASVGFQDWNDSTNLGSNQAIYVEDSTYNADHSGSEGFFDGYYGCKLVIRYSTINGNELGGWHGTDSGGYRACVLGEIYNNTINKSAGTTTPIYNTRGGTTLFFNNTVGGTDSWGSIMLQYYRVSEQGPAESSFWGNAGSGLNWTPTVANYGPSTANAPDFVPSHSYAALTVVGPLSNNAGKYNFQLTNGPMTCGAYPASWNQTVAATTTDSAGCVWENVGGATTVGPGGAGFCAANPDTQCSANSTCNALSQGDTCSRYFDANGGVYPFRDQPGRTHNQLLTPNYAWNNTISNLIGPVFNTDSSTSGIIQSGIDYYNDTEMPGYTPYTYPDPLQGGDPPPPPAPPTGLTAVVQ